jgi:hypothetical protein
MAEHVRFDLFDPPGVSGRGVFEPMHQRGYLLAEEDTEKSHQRNHGWCG